MLFGTYPDTTAPADVTSDDSTLSTSASYALLAVAGLIGFILYVARHPEAK